MHNNIDTLINHFVTQIKSSQNEEHLQEILHTLVKLSQGSHSLSDLKIVNETLNEYYRTFKVFAPFKDARKVCIFGSARTKSEDKEYQLCAELCNMLTQKGYMVITGAGPGIMEAGNKGADLNMSFGLSIDLPSEQSSNQYIAHSPKLVNYKYFFTRKLTFIRESDATVLFPGGYGTHDEGFENLTLIQTGRCAPRPLIMIAKPESDYWTKWAEFIKEQLLNRGFISEGDLNLFQIVSNAEEAVSLIDEFYKVYHSIHYLDNYTVIRLNKEISDELLEKINENFADLLVNGKFERASLADVPEDAAEYPNKARLKFNFKVRMHGRLHEMIRFINSF